MSLAQKGRGITVVALGCPADVHPVSLLPVCGIPARARGRAGSGAPRPVRRGARDLRAVPGAFHPSERLSVPHAASPAHYPEAERAVAAGQHAGDVAVFPRGVHPVVRGVRDAALRIVARTRRAAGGARRPCLTCPRTPATWWRRTS